MDGVQLFLLFSGIIGAGAALFAAVFIPDEKQSVKISPLLETEGSIRALSDAQDEAEKTIDDLSHFMQSATKEIEDKYQEMLFMYNLIDEKRAELAKLYMEERSGERRQKRAEPAPEAPLPPLPEKKRGERERAFAQDSKYNEVLKLHGEGLSVQEISKKINVGQGEVSLIVGMFAKQN
ncbi:MAG: hypothetical protein LBU36_03995 [Clostridiales bacterium]|jgi:hypothetical protein|nr:hypothetical protein [Clostridiales bacterium]